MKKSDYPFNHSQITPPPLHYLMVRRLTAEEGSGWLVEIPDYPGIIVTGDTVEEAIEKAIKAKDGWIKTQGG